MRWLADILNEITIVRTLNVTDWLSIKLLARNGVPYSVLFESQFPGMDLPVVSEVLVTEDTECLWDNLLEG